MSDALDDLHKLTRDVRRTLQALQASGVGWASAGKTASKPIEASGDDRSNGDQQAAPRTPGTKTLAVVRETLGECQRCSLAQTRQHIVFGVGSEQAELMFVGEAPGADEDRTGEPFVGRAGQLLDKMIVAMGWQRESVYIANVLKCRPPNNRDPKTEEVAACEGVLAQQIQVVAPKVIVTLGKPAAHLLLKSNQSMRALRGIWHEWHGIAVMPTFHPAYLLRDPSKKRDTWADLQQVMTFFAERGIRDPRQP